MTDLANLLNQTTEVLEQNGKSPRDVRWVGVPGKWATSWQEFAAHSDFEYDDSYGGAEIEEELLVVGDDWWLERGEYDGSEWWAFKTMPQGPENLVDHITDKHLRRNFAFLMGQK
jgi:hypothetical protein